MGNCQAVDAAALVIQHPTGKSELMYYPVTAAHVMKMNPGHHVSLIIPLHLAGSEENDDNDDKRRVRYTRVQLLRPTDTLLLGHAYRLLTTEEVVRVIRAKKCEKLSRKKKKNKGETSGEDHQQQKKNAQNHQGCRSWRPALQSISELAGA